MGHPTTVSERKTGRTPWICIDARSSNLSAYGDTGRVTIDEHNCANPVFAWTLLFGYVNYPTTSVTIPVYMVLGYLLDLLPPPAMLKSTSLPHGDVNESVVSLPGPGQHPGINDPGAL